MSLPVVRKTRRTTSGAVDVDTGRFWGFVVNSHTSGTVTIYDSLAGSGDIIFNTITFPAGSGLVYTLPYGVNYTLGCYATIGGTADITFLWGDIR